MHAPLSKRLFPRRTYMYVSQPASQPFCLPAQEMWKTICHSLSEVRCEIWLWKEKKERKWERERARGLCVVCRREKVKDTDQGRAGSGMHAARGGRASEQWLDSYVNWPDRSSEYYKVVDFRSGRYANRYKDRYISSPHLSLPEYVNILQ